MTVLAPQGDGMCGSRGVERCPARELLAGPGVLVPLPAEYPLPQGRLLCPLAHQGRHFVLAGAGSGVDMMSAVGIAEQVYMRVDEAGQDGSAAQVHQFGMKATDAAHLVVVAHCYNTPVDAVDGHGLGSRPGGVHSVDVAVEKENGTHEILPSVSNISVVEINILRSHIHCLGLEYPPRRSWVSIDRARARLPALCPAVAERRGRRRRQSRLRLQAPGTRRGSRPR